jgi:hypothetical protein
MPDDRRFRGYPIPADAHADRPWWRFTHRGLWRPGWVVTHVEEGSACLYLGGPAPGIYVTPEDTWDRLWTGQTALGSYAGAQHLPLSWIREHGWAPFLRSGQTVLDALDAIDRENPLPVPRPLVGDVWLRVEDQDEDDAFGVNLGPRQISTVDAFSFLGPTPVRWRVGFSDAPDRIHDYGPVDVLSPNACPWPPPGAVCVWGPSAPWAPPRPEVPHG